MATFAIDLLSGTALLLTGNFGSSGSTSSSWGSIIGVLSGQTDLQNTLNTKLNISAFNNYTGTTIPNTLNTKLNISAFNNYTGTTIPNTYNNKTEIDNYTGSSVVLLTQRMAKLFAYNNFD